MARSSSPRKLGHGAAPQAGSQRGIVDLHARDDDRVRGCADHGERDGLYRVPVTSAGELDCLVQLLQPQPVAEIEWLLEVKPVKDQRCDEVGVQLGSKKAALALTVCGEQDLVIIGRPRARVNNGGHKPRRLKPDKPHGTIVGNLGRLRNKIKPWERVSAGTEALTSSY